MPDKKIIIISITVAIFCVSAYTCYIMISESNLKAIDTAKKRELTALQQNNDFLKKELSTLKEEINRSKVTEVSSERLEEVFGQKASLLLLGENKLTFQEIEEMVMKFFSYIDQKDYIKRNKLTGSAYDQYKILEDSLSSTAPVGNGETQDLYNLTQNASHFYRTLGKQRVSLVTDILAGESDIIESAMKTFYVWYTYKNDSGEKMKGQPSIQTLYDYSNFFLNSLGGKGYLFRRDSKTRILTNLYSVMILDIANDKKLNPNGTDIKPFIKMSYDEISNTLSLVDRMEYLAMLDKLKTKYKIV